MADDMNKNPWLGLESYHEGEILYGRDDDIRDLSQSILRDKVTLLYGKSGIGKSSILNAGIIPVARRYSYKPVSVRLSHKEGKTYLQQVDEAICQAGIEKHKVLNAKDPQEEDFYEYFHRYTFYDARGERQKLLIIFDQFEEIFTLQSKELTKKDFFAQMADFINDIMPARLEREVVITRQKNGPINDNKLEDKVESSANSLDDILGGLSLDLDEDVPEYVTDNVIHLVFTIREDFLSEFEYYTAAIPSLKQNRYGLRPLNEEQAAQIILKPVPGLVTKEVAKLIIEKITGRTDFLLDGKPEIDVDSAILSLYMNRLYDTKEGDTITASLVEQKGGEIIKDFYLDAISSVSSSSVEFLEDNLLNGQGRRDNITSYDAEHDGKVTYAELNILCNKKKILRQFNYANDLRLEFVHDILCPVVKEHKDERIARKQLQEEQRRQEEEKQRFLRKQKEELDRLERESIRQRRKFKYRLMASLSLLAIGIIGILSWWLLTRYPFSVYYASFTTKDGWPVGLGEELGDIEKQQMPVYYELIRYGYLNKHNVRVNILNRKEELSRNKFNESPLVSLYETEANDEKAKAFAILQRRTAYWIFTPDNEGNILRQSAYDIDDSELYTIQFFRSSVVSGDGDLETSQRKQLWANYVDTEGKAMAIRDNGADRMRVIADDSTGYYTGYQFYSETGTPQANNDGYYGYRYKVDIDGRVLKKTPVDAFGDEIKDKSTTYRKFDKYGRWTSSLSGHAIYNKNLVVFSKKDRTDTLRFNDNGDLVRHSETLGQNLSRIFFYSKGHVSSCYFYRISLSGKQLFHSERTVEYKDKGLTETYAYWADSVMPYQIKRQQQHKNNLTVSFWGGQTSKHINIPILMTTSEGCYHKMETDTVAEGEFIKVTKRFYGIDGKLSWLGEYNCEESYYNSNKERIKRIVYKNGIRLYAYLNEYDDGQLIAQSVLGIDRKTPIRYPNWDKYHFCYYKMKMIYNFSNMLVAVKGINEFGEESLITTVGGEKYMVDVLPSREMSSVKDNYDIYGVQVYKVQMPLVNKSLHVEYIHINDLNGAWYKAGIRDGDLLVSEGSSLTIARPDKPSNTYILRKIKAPKGSSGAEHYSVYFNKKEMYRYLKAVKKYEK